LLGFRPNRQIVSVCLNPTSVTKRNILKKIFRPVIVSETMKKSTKAIIITCSIVFCVSGLFFYGNVTEWDPDPPVVIPAILMAVSLGTIIGIKLAK
tara:strand:- start:704 stop:991 length:288 start_codon:yes stop_codon:yes gene_type:complete